MLPNSGTPSFVQSRPSGYIDIAPKVVASPDVLFLGAPRPWHLPVPPGWSWWATYATVSTLVSTPRTSPRLRAHGARRVLAQPVCASAAERNWSVYGMIKQVIKTSARGRMGHAVVDKLVYSVLCHEALVRSKERHAVPSYRRRATPRRLRSGNPTPTPMRLMTMIWLDVDSMCAVVKRMGARHQD